MSFVIPAIDLKDGKCVQLQGGDPQKVLFTRDDPIQAAKEFSKDFDLLHVVDLDAALGTGSNLELIKQIAGFAKIQVGGGIRDPEKAKEMLQFADRIIVGTNPSILKQLPEYKERLILALDSKDGKVSTKGWTEELEVGPESLAGQYKDLVGAFLYTCINKEGRQNGPDLEGTEKIVKCGKTLASGGISSIEDIEALKQLGVSGVVVGSALYSGKLNLDEVITYEKSRSE